ncbi:MAG: 16S rRNA (guanine(527)-N(7))-methyltransferase RsmG [Gammaproteobacteria bacterium]|nr:16S rRNA (guanine(527)-N(7))-methyltransferase RsmG [Gammaproteobacteria bacterium]MYF29785.1 16S rRNA (guanine(527)-N(7))-methyltransferase RsmG [Gammaproteobacteria bacterium]MYK47737.1 16S rRNA (guanine(527)-N(7))-methyltransferase RsmG [Gammaproteobacteria bacterium]
MPANNAAREALARFLEQRGVEPDRAVEALEDYEGLIRRWNARGNLVSRRDIGRLRDRHVLDSLSLLPWWRGTLLDVGSGAGFPGVPLAIARPASPVTLVERSERKARFLRQAVIDLGLGNVEVIEADVGRRRAWCSLGGRVFDTVTARAVAPPRTTWSLLRELLAPEGVALLQSGDPLDATLFNGGEIRIRERMEQTWVTVVGKTGVSSGPGVDAQR